MQAPEQTEPLPGQSGLGDERSEGEDAPRTSGNEERTDERGRAGVLSSPGPEAAGVDLTRL